MARKSNPAPSTKRWRKWFDTHGDPTRKKRRDKWERSQGKTTIRRKKTGIYEKVQKIAS